MTTTLEKPKCLHREEQPVKACLRCGAYLRSFANEAYCDPCLGKPDAATLSDAEVIELIAEMPDVRQRRKAFDALAELQEEAV